MPKIRIVRSISIDAPAKKIFTVLNNFNHWIPWSPWLLMDPEVKVEVAEDAKSYQWEGQRVGSGNMKVLNEIENKTIDFELNFIKPWKSTAKTTFQLIEKDGSTEVSWSMDSALPFFMFWMRKSMEAYVGADYERGLDMLKVYVESGNVPSKLSFEGVAQYDGCSWIGIKTNCSLDTVATQMQADYGMLWGYAEKNKDINVGKAFTMYHKWDIVKSKVTYTAAICVGNLPDTLPESFTSGKRPNSKAYQLKHTGDYNFLGNAWSTGYAMMRNKEFKYNKKLTPFEIYLNNPTDTKPKDLITVVHFPVK